MVKIICRAVDCIFWEDGLCSSEEITYDLDEGCLTYEVIDDVLGMEDDDDWDDDEGDELENLIDDDDSGFYIEDTSELALYEDDNW